MTEFTEQEIKDAYAAGYGAGVLGERQRLKTRIEEAVSKVAYRIEREAWDTDASLAVNAVRDAVLAVLEES